MPRLLSRPLACCGVTSLLIGFAAIGGAIFFGFMWSNALLDLDKARYLDSPRSTEGCDQSSVLGDGICPTAQFKVWKMPKDEIVAVCEDTQNEPTSELLKSVSGWSGDKAEPCPELGKDFNVYVFNLTNPAQVVHSNAVPVVEELGPIRGMKLTLKTLDEADEEYWHQTGIARFNESHAFVLKDPEGQKELLDSEVVVPYLAFWTPTLAINRKYFGNLEYFFGGMLTAGALAQTAGVVAQTELPSKVVAPLAGVAYLREAYEAAAADSLSDLLVMAGATLNTSDLGTVPHSDLAAVAVCLDQCVAEAEAACPSAAHANPALISGKEDCQTAKDSLIARGLAAAGAESVADLLTSQMHGGAIASLCESLSDAGCSTYISDSVVRAQVLDRLSFGSFVASPAASADHAGLTLTASEAESVVASMSDPMQAMALVAAGSCPMDSAAKCAAVKAWLAHMALQMFKEITADESVTSLDSMTLLKKQYSQSGLSRLLGRAAGYPDPPLTLRDLGPVLGAEVAAALPVLSIPAMLGGCVDSIATPGKCGQSHLTSLAPAVTTAGVETVFALSNFMATGDAALVQGALMTMSATYQAMAKAGCMADPTGAVLPASDCAAILGHFQMIHVGHHMANAVPLFNLGADLTPYFIKITVRQLLGIDGAAAMDPWFGPAGVPVSFGAMADQPAAGKTEIAHSKSAMSDDGLQLFKRFNGHTKECRLDMDCVMPNQPLASLDGAECEESDICQPKKIEGSDDTRLLAGIFGSGTFTDVGTEVTLFAPDIVTQVKFRKISHRQNLLDTKVEVDRWHATEVISRDENCNMTNPDDTRGLDCDSPLRALALGTLIAWPAAPPVYGTSPHFWNDPITKDENLYAKRDADVYDPAERVKIIPSSVGSADAPRDFATFLEVEPETGLVISGFNRLQFNVRLSWPVAGDSSDSAFGVAFEHTDLLLPVFWGEETATATPHQLKNMKDLQKAEETTDGALIGLIALAVIFTLSGVWGVANGYQWKERTVMLQPQQVNQEKQAMRNEVDLERAEEALQNESAAAAAADPHEEVPHPNVAEEGTVLKVQEL